MIQRIQSIFLLLAAVASFGLFKLPFASTNNVVANSLFDDRIFNIQDHPALIGFLAGAGLLALIAIFLFNNRSLQLKISRVAIVANIVGIVFGVFLFMQAGAAMPESVVPNDELGMWLPLISTIFAGLGIYFINKDEKLVKSMDRLR